MSVNSDISYDIIPFRRWRYEISDLWMMQGSYKRIPPIILNAGQVQFVGPELASRILLFPIAASHKGRRVGWTSVYNISDTSLRIRGIYVLPDFRSNGIGRGMAEYAMNLWPLPWSKCFMYARSSNVERYLRWGFTVEPGHVERSAPDIEALGESGIILMSKEFRLSIERQREGAQPQLQTAEPSFAN